MGHIRLGSPPATRKWREVVALLGASELRVGDIAEAVERASDRSLATAVDDPAFIEALWLLTKIPLAAKEDDFAVALRKLGIRVPDEPRMADILAGFAHAIDRVRTSGGRAVSDFSILARNAAIAALNSLTKDRSPSLWQANAKDERITLASFASTDRFGELAQRFFTSLLEGHLQYFLEREVPRHIGRSSFARSIADTRQFESVVHRHCEETTVIMSAYAREWLGKNRFHLGIDLKREDTTAFAAFAFTKVRNELANRSGGPP